MRLILLAALIAGTATPAIAAADQRFERGDNARSERSERISPRAERAQRSQRRQARANDARTEEAQPRVERSRRGVARVSREAAERPAVGPVERRLRGQRLERRAPPAAARVSVEQDSEIAAPVARERSRQRVQRTAGRGGDSVRDWRVNERRVADGPSAIHERNMRSAPEFGRGGEGLAEPRRPLPRVLDRDPSRIARRVPAPDARPPEPASARLAHARPSRHWRTDWRRDRRHDWRDHRRRHGSLFRIGIYYDPFGWNYRRYGIGWRLWPSHYSNRYWLNDPWMYRLPPAYGPYRWVRYWDDALLVNIYTGQVVDVVHNFFW